MQLNTAIEILRLEKLKIKNESSKNFQINGFYTIGIKSRPHFITISSQQNRAEMLAEAIHKFSTERQLSPLKVLVVGGGFAGISFVKKLNFLSSEKYKIRLLEKASEFCHLQSMCTIRRIHPNVHLWPNDWEDNEKMPRPGGIKWSANSADKVALEFKTALDLMTKGESAEDRKFYINCNNLVFKEKNKKFNFSFSAKEYRSDDHFEDELFSYYKSEVDIVVFSSGFGIERHANFVNEKTLSERVQRSYWRNDPIGQSNLNVESNIFLVSGCGDGALVDLFRIYISDFYQDDSLKQLIPIDLEEDAFESFVEIVYSNSEDRAKKDLVKKSINDYKKLQEILIEIGSTPKDPKKSLFYSLEELFSSNQIMYSVFSESLRRRIRKVKCILHILRLVTGSKNKIEQIVDNTDITFYNRVLFYLIYAFADIEVVATENWSANLDDKDIAREREFNDIRMIISKYNVPVENIVIRHGVDRIKPIKNLFLDSGYVWDDNYLRVSNKNVKSQGLQAYIDGVIFVEPKSKKSVKKNTAPVELFKKALSKTKKNKQKEKRIIRKKQKKRMFSKKASKKR